MKMYRNPDTRLEQPQRPFGENIVTRQLQFAPVPPPQQQNYFYNQLADLPQSGYVTVAIASNAYQVTKAPLKIRSVTVLAPSTNAGTIFTGGKEALFPLVPGASIVLTVSDLSTVWIQGSTVNDLAFWIAEAFTK
jgi:hypothetical protein